MAEINTGITLASTNAEATITNKHLSHIRDCSERGIIGSKKGNANEATENKAYIPDVDQSCVCKRT